MRAPLRLGPAMADAEAAPVEAAPEAAEAAPAPAEAAPALAEAAPAPEEAAPHVFGALPTAPAVEINSYKGLEKTYAMIKPDAVAVSRGEGQDLGALSRKPVAAGDGWGGRRGW